MPRVKMVEKHNSKVMNVLQDRTMLKPRGGTEVTYILYHMSSSSSSSKIKKMANKRLQILNMFLKCGIR